MKRMLLIAFCLMAIFSSMFIVADHFGYADEAYVRQQLEAVQSSENGSLLVAGAIIGLLVIDLLLPVPSSIVMVVSGAAFGIAGGAAVSFVGSMLAAIIGFSLCRRGGQKIFEKLIGEDDIKSIETWFENYGTLAIILSRPVPMLTEILSCLAGLSELPARTFLLASALGHLPICLVYAIAGATSSIENPWPAAVVALMVPATGWFVTVKIKGRKQI